jgi:hypothetical protein
MVAIRRAAVGGALGVLSILMGLAPAWGGPGTFQLVGPMVQTRQGAVATLLKDGSVLVTGGYGSDTIPLATAERFDPVTNTFSALPPMGHKREYHAAVRLKDGRVLIVGGAEAYDSATQQYAAVAPAEVFDPATGKFSLVGSLVVPRYAMTATLLPDGRVLVAGGVKPCPGCVQTLGDAELFDPATGQFQKTGRMAVGRDSLYSSTPVLAVSLPNGRVAMLGGGAAAVEIYDPAQGGFVAARTQYPDRPGATSVPLSNGKVLRVGSARVVGLINDAVLKQIWLYDPVTGRTAVLGSLGEARQEPLAVELGDGTALVAGGTVPAVPSMGFALPASPLTSAERFNLTTGKRTPTGAPLDPQNGGVAVRLQDGRVLIVGGGYSASIAGLVSTPEVYVP